MRVKLERQLHHRKVPFTAVRRYDVAKLARNRGRNDCGSTQRSSFKDQMVDRVVTEWPAAGSVE